MKRAKDQTYYDLLEVARGASTEEIQKAYRRAKEIFSAHSLATYSLLEPEELKRINGSIDDAYRVLTDERLRSDYDRGLDGLGEKVLPEESPGTAAGEAIPIREAATGIVFPNDFRFTGTSLKGIRESMGIDLKQIARKTKINRRYLEWLEEERFEYLPALVYLRGFVMEYARTLNLDPQKVADNYLESFHQWQNERKG
jgi:flagellar biosynthesis protein FlhG